MRRLLLVLLEEIGRLIQDVAILWDEEVSVPLMNLKLLPIREIREECRHFPKSPERMGDNLQHLTKGGLVDIHSECIETASGDYFL